jgi:hypothetical protein
MPVVMDEFTRECPRINVTRSLNCVGCGRPGDVCVPTLTWTLVARERMGD